jgi:hypothetical protein
MLKMACGPAGSILLSQPIMVAPKIIKPAAPMSPGYGYGRGRGFQGRGAPFSPVQGRFGGRGRGRQQTPLSSHKYVRPDFQAQLERQKLGDGAEAALT